MSSKERDRGGGDDHRTSFPRDGAVCGNLDDCYTNVYALTELNELHWRIYEHTSHTASLSRLHEDPVIKAYGNCLQGKLLCTYRRQMPPLADNQTQVLMPVFSDSEPKELWVFWLTADEPEALAAAVEGLTEKPQNNLDAAQPIINPEVRQMLFNAFHTYLSMGFTREGHLRFGKWHTRPVSPPRPGMGHLQEKLTLGFSMRFFIAGASTVCVAFVSQKQPTLFRLSKAHIDLNERFGVILSPWSLRATYVGIDLAKYNVDAEVEYPKWRPFWFAHSEGGLEEIALEPDMPRMVIVEIDKTPMIVPTAMIAVTWEQCPLANKNWHIVKKEPEPVNKERLFQPPRKSTKHLQEPQFLKRGIKMKNGELKNPILCREGEIWPVLGLSIDNVLLQPKMSAEPTFSKAPDAPVTGPLLQLQNDPARTGICRKGRGGEPCKLCLDCGGGMPIKPVKPRDRQEELRKAPLVSALQGKRQYIRVIEATVNNPAESERCPYDTTVMKTVLDNLAEEELKADQKLTAGPRNPALGKNNQKPAEKTREERQKDKAVRAEKILQSGRRKRKWPIGERAKRWRQLIDHIKMRKTRIKHSYSEKYGKLSKARLPPAPIDEKRDDSSADSSDSEPEDDWLTMHRVDPFETAIYCNAETAPYRYHFVGPSTSKAAPEEPEIQPFSPITNKEARLAREGNPAEQLSKYEESRAELMASIQEERAMHLRKKWPHTKPRWPQEEPEDSNEEPTAMSCDPEPKASELRRKTGQRKQRKDIEVRGPARPPLLEKRRIGLERVDWPSSSNTNLGEALERNIETEEYYEEDPFEGTFSEESEGEPVPVFFGGAAGEICEPGKGPGSLVWNYGTKPPTDDMMDADECMVAGQMAQASSDYLSPPASNELQAPSSVHSFPRGPPSVPPSHLDPQLNNIYPTPPSVQPQQPSPLDNHAERPPVHHHPEVTGCPQESWSDEHIDGENLVPDGACGKAMASVVSYVKENPFYRLDKWGDFPRASRYSAGNTRQAPRLRNNGLVDYGKVQHRLKRCHRKGDGWMDKVMHVLRTMDTRKQVFLLQQQNAAQHPSMMAMHHRMGGMGPPMGPPRGIPGMPGRPGMPTGPPPRYGMPGHFGPGPSTMPQSPHPVQQLHNMVNNPSYGGMGAPYPGVPQPAIPPHMHAHMGTAAPQHQMPMPQQPPPHPHMHMGHMGPSGMAPPQPHMMMGGAGQMMGGQMPGMGGGVGPQPVMGPPMGPPQSMGHHGMMGHHQPMMMGGPQGHVNPMMNQQPQQPMGPPSVPPQMAQQHMWQRDYRMGGFGPGPSHPGMGGPQEGMYPPPQPAISYPSGPFGGYQPAPSHGHPQYGAPPMAPRPMPQLGPPGMMAPQQPSAVGPYGGHPHQQMPSLGPPASLFKQEMLPEQPVDPSLALLPSLPLSLLLSDTILDLHFDSNFDACPLCSCNASIKTRELGFYLSPHEVLTRSPAEQGRLIQPWSGFFLHQNQHCTCGFSAIRYRALSMRAGLFPEDAREATGDVSISEMPGLLGDDDPSIWFDISMQHQTRAAAREAMNMLDMVRRMSLHSKPGLLIQRALLLAETAESQKPQARPPPYGDPTQLGERAEYFVSDMDRTELLLVWSAAVNALMPRLAPNELPAGPEISQYIHPWGLQQAKDTHDVPDHENRALLDELKPALELAIRTAKNFDAKPDTQTTQAVDGPLTWRKFALKCSKATQEEEREQASQTMEPIPSIVVAGERDSGVMRVSPQAIPLWESASFGPVDQPKDVFYLVCTLDDSQLADRAQNYFEELSKRYEQLRYGKHVPLPRNDPKETNGILRVPPVRQQNNQLQMSSCAFWKTPLARQYDLKVMITVQHFCGTIEATVARTLSRNGFNLFERETFRRTIAEHQRGRIGLMQLYAKSIESDMKQMDRRSTSQKNSVYRHCQLDKLLVDEPQDEAQNSSKESAQARDTAGTSKATVPEGEATSQPSAGEPMMVDMPEIKEEPKSVNNDPNATAQQPAASSSSQPPKPSTSAAPEPPTAALTAQQREEQIRREHQAPKYTSQFPGGLPTPAPKLPSLPPEDIPEDEPGLLNHVIVIYLVDPFCTGARALDPRFARVLSQAYLRTYSAICQLLPVKWRARIQFEIVPASQILDHYGLYSQQSRPQAEHVETKSSYDYMRDLCLSVYSQPRVLDNECVKSIQPKSMTKFGPASGMVEEMDRWTDPYFYQIHSNPLKLAPDALLQERPDGTLSHVDLPEQVLYVTYCLLGDEWLCASVTDQQGELRDNCLINMKPDNPRRLVVKFRKRTQIFDAMEKLWLYIQGQLTVATSCWRVVIGKLGRIGHTEFKAWAALLSKPSLKRYNARMKDGCQHCQNVPAHIPVIHQECPVILSACLVSFEPEPTIRVLPSCLEKGGRGRSGQGQGPEDQSITHIIVYPQSVDVQPVTADTLAQGHDDDDAGFEFDIGIDDIGEDMRGILQDLGEEDLQPQTAGLRSHYANLFDGVDTSFENQPLAAGYYISTAPAPDLPEWFWASAMSSRGQVPTHLKASLHINVTQVQAEDSFGAGNTAKDKAQEQYSHPLDSNRTDEVLRNVLETYNSLSWLEMDPMVNDRRSCLPIHMQNLLKLYHNVRRFIL
ncbi:unnamed protein product, partial [Mesorhabditis spiculigera]